MAEINPDIQARIDKLPVRQQAHFVDLVQQAEPDQLRKELTSGKVDPDFLITTQLAIAALTDSGRQGLNYTQETYCETIQSLRKTGSVEEADRLQELLDKSRKKEEQEQVRAEKAQAGQAKHTEKQEQDRLKVFEKDYGDRKAERISELIRWGRMDADQAEACFEQVESAQVSASIKRLHGVV